MTKKNNLKKGNSSFLHKKMKRGTSKSNSWKHQMYELEIAIAKESSCLLYTSDAADEL